MNTPASERTRRRRRGRRRSRRSRYLLLIVLAVVVTGLVGRAVESGGHAPSPSSPGRRLTAVNRPKVHVLKGPIPGYLLIADRGNDRLLLVDSRKRVVWRYPPPAGPVYPFHFDDDAFFGPGFRTIISNQEDQHTIQILGFPNRRPLWHYGHVNRRGSAPGYLNTPDDAYLLPNGLVSVADAYNCRVLFINRAHKIVRQLGQAPVCAHAPPGRLGAVNGATPLPGGGTLVSEITGSWIDAFSGDGRLMWAFKAPVSYPSDPQWLGGGRILLADYTRPGQALIINRHGRVLWRYAPASGRGELDHPSLALSLGHGLIAINDDFRHRVVVINIRYHRIIWQYGHTDAKGRTAGHLNTPDGMDLLPTAQALTIPALQTLLRRLDAHQTHPKPTPTAGPLRVRLAPFRLPAPVERAVAVAWQGQILIAGGLDARGQSAAGIFALHADNGKLRSLGTLPLPFHDAAGALVGVRLFVFGGGSSTSSNAVQAFDLSKRRGSIIGRLPRALSDLAAAQLNGSVYLIGGYDGHSPRAEILATRDGRHFTLAARLPLGLRYPAVANSGGKILIAGGQTTTGLSTTVYSFDPTTRRVKLLTRLPAPLAHATAIAKGNTLYIIGGTDSHGHTPSSLTTINLTTRSTRTLRSPIGGIADAASAQLGNTTFLIGGRRNQTIATVLEIQTR